MCERECVGEIVRVGEYESVSECEKERERERGTNF